MRPLVLSFSTSCYGGPTTIGQFIGKARLKKGLKQSDLREAMDMEEMPVVDQEGYEALPVCAKSRS